jgi:hypothetical protein
MKERWGQAGVVPPCAHSGGGRRGSPLRTRRRWWPNLEVEGKAGKERRRRGEEEVGERAAGGDTGAGRGDGVSGELGLG